MYSSRDFKYFQHDILNEKRYDLLNSFCEYDIGKISQIQLLSDIQAMGIQPTLATKKYLRRNLGSLNFSQFLMSLGTPNDTVIEQNERDFDDCSITDTHAYPKDSYQSKSHHISNEPKHNHHTQTDPQIKPTGQTHSIQTTNSISTNKIDFT